MTKNEARRILAELVRRREATRWSPQDPTPKQAAFLALDCEEALFGGGAGGGKSSVLLMAALQYVHVPGYAALILRRTFKDLALPDAIMDRAHQWLRGKAPWDADNKTYRFPSGATLTFGYLENEKDKLRYQGAAFQFFGVDEAGQFTETQYTYLHSRLRKPVGMNVPLRARCTANPGGVGHDFLHKRFILEPGNRVFVPSLLADNPHLDQETYRASLAKLDDITRRQLEFGEWIRNSQGRLYSYLDTRNGVDALPRFGTSPIAVVGVDLGASQNSPSTAFVVLVAHHGLIYAVHSEAQAGMTPTTIAGRIAELAEEYQPIDIVVDAGGLGGGYIEDFRAHHHLPVRAADKTNKLGYRKAMNGDLEQGRMFVWRPGCQSLVQEFEALEWNDKGTDCVKGAAAHNTDACLYARRAISLCVGEKPAPEVRPGTAEYMRLDQELLDRQNSGDEDE